MSPHQRALIYSLWFPACCLTSREISRREPSLRGRPKAAGLLLSILWPRNYFSGHHSHNPPLPETRQRPAKTQEPKLLSPKSAGSKQAVNSACKRLIFNRDNVTFRLREECADFLPIHYVNDSVDLLELSVRDHYVHACLLYTSPSPRDATLSRMPSSA